MSSSTTSPMMCDVDDDDGDGGGHGLGKGPREGDLERLMRSLSEDVTNTQTHHQQGQLHGFEQQQQLHEFGSSQQFQQQQQQSLSPGEFSSASLFSQSQPSFLLELLSMPAPSLGGWNSSSLLPDLGPILSSTSSLNLHSFGSQRQPEVFWDSLPDYPPLFLPTQDSLPELLSSSEPWSTVAPAAPAPESKQLTSHSSGVTSSAVTRSPSSPARLNSAASTLPSTPNSSLSSGSFSDAAGAEEDHQSHGHGGSSTSGRPLLQHPQPVAGPSGSSSAHKRKTPDGNVDESCDEIQSLDSKKP